MGYTEALKAAGAKVLLHKTVGSYQGEWVAVVEKDGEVKALHAYYGSCSGCDAFEAEFGYDIHSYESHGDGTYFSNYDEGTWRDDCAECQNFKAKLKVFGEKYLAEAVPVADLIVSIGKDVMEYGWEDKAQLKDALAEWLAANG